MENENTNYDYRDFADGVWFYHDDVEIDVHTLCHSQRRVVVPYYLLCFRRKDAENLINTILTK